MVKDVTIPFRQFTAEGSGTRAWLRGTPILRATNCGNGCGSIGTRDRPLCKGNIVDSTNDPTALLMDLLSYTKGLILWLRTKTA